MKKSLLLAILGVACGASSSYAQGYVYLDNYTTYGPYITIAYGIVGTTPAGGLNSSFTVGMYYHQGAMTGADADTDLTPYHNGGLPSSLFLATGSGSTAQAGFGVPGAFFSGNAFQANSAAGGISTVMLVAYDGPTYYTSVKRGHSVAFEITTKGATDLPPARIGDFMPAFTVYVPAPEPSTVTLAGLGLVSMLVARRRK